MRVAAVQHDIVWEDPEANFARLAPQIAEAAGAGAQLVALTEMYSTGFSADVARIAEPVDGPSTRFLAEQAVTHGVWVCGSVAERAPGAERPTNCLVLAGPAGERHRYAKIHPFSFAGEHERFASGDRTVTVVVDGVRVSLFVCYDLRFADDFWALAPDTDCYLVVANWPAPRRAHWQTLLRARAIENQAYVVGVNRVGEGGRLEYAGDSAVIGPFGEEVAVGDDTGDVGAEQKLLAAADPTPAA
ncbi:MAG: nitrilase-related carbon-nitrogen hydrolase, partial [Actinomycetota bacterium]